MKLFLSILLSLNFMTAAEAKVNISKQFKFSLKNLTELENILDFASKRNEEMMKFPFNMKTNHEEGVILGCPPNYPDMEKRVVQ